MSSLVDSHCHLYYEPYINDIQGTINDCKKNNINKLLTIGVDIATSKKNIELAQKYSEIYCTIGIHPNSTAHANIDDLLKLNRMIKLSEKVIGIGETGLDYYREFDKNLQFFYFEEQIKIAKKFNLPVIIHTRDAEDDTYSIIKKYYDNNLKFIIHCFSGSVDFAKKCSQLGCYLSFSGNITFKNANNIREACKEVDIEKILIETDSPYLTPHPHRGKKNHPSNVRYVCNEISRIKKIDFNTVSKITTKNFNSIFFNG
jgi:TatD DNase family protein